MAEPLPLGLTLDPANEVVSNRLLEIELRDFEPVRQYTAKRTGWDAARILAAELSIKRMFALEILDPGRFHVPEDDADEYWHSMILDTVWYQKFCNATLGAYLHHKPNLDGVELPDAVARSVKLFSILFDHKMAGPSRPPVVPHDGAPTPPPPPPPLPGRQFRLALNARLGGVREFRTGAV